MTDNAISVYSMYTSGRRGKKITSLIGKTRSVKPPGRTPVFELPFYIEVNTDTKGLVGSRVKSKGGSGGERGAWLQRPANIRAVSVSGEASQRGTRGCTNGTNRKELGAINPEEQSEGGVGSSICGGTNGLLVKSRRREWCIMR